MSDAPETTAVLNNDLPCAKCGYNLRTLNRNARCPECATAVIWTLSLHHDFPPRWRYLAARRLFIIGPSFLIFLATLVIGWIVAVVIQGPFGFLAFLCVGICGEHALRLAGVMLATHRPHLPLSWKYSSMPSVLRVMAFIEASVGLAFLLFIFMLTQGPFHDEDLALALGIIIAGYILMRSIMMFLIGRFMEGLLREAGAEFRAGLITGVIALVVGGLLAILIVVMTASDLNHARADETTQILVITALGFLFLAGCALHVWMFGLVTWAGIRLKKLAGPGAGAVLESPLDHFQRPGHGAVDVDLLCGKCGYNLRTLEPESRCPECGTSVGWTHELLEKYPMERRGRAAWRLLAVAITLPVPLGVLALAAVSYPVDDQKLYWGILLIEHVARLAAITWLTMPDGIPKPLSNGMLRQWLRAAAAAELITFFALLIMYWQRENDETSSRGAVVVMAVFYMISRGTVLFLAGRLIDKLLAATGRESTFGRSMGNALLWTVALFAVVAVIILGYSAMNNRMDIAKIMMQMCAVGTCVMLLALTVVLFVLLLTSAARIRRASIEG